MPASVDSLKAKQRGKVIRDTAFANRLNVACEGNPRCPTELHRGKQKWIYDNLLEDFGIKVSAEAVRKWFASESHPRPNAMRAVAKLLDVDEAWLSLGLTPDLSPHDQKRRNAMADGAVNLVAGMIQIGGGHIAFPENGTAHIAAIIGGKHLTLDVVLPFALERDQYRLTIEDRLEGKHIVVLMPKSAFTYGVIVLTAPVVREFGHLRGNYWELIIEQYGLKWRAGTQKLFELYDVQDLSKASELY